MEHNLTELQQQERAKDFNCESFHILFFMHNMIFFFFTTKETRDRNLDAYDKFVDFNLTDSQLIFLLNNELKKFK